LKKGWVFSGLTGLTTSSGEYFCGAAEKAGNTENCTNIPVIFCGKSIGLGVQMQLI
jgi:hypothetical protein